MSFKTEVKLVQGIQEYITFYIGKNAYGNFEIIDNSEEDDLWFHVNNDSSCHVIASIPSTIDRKDVKYIVKQGAILCRQNSRFKSSKIPVDIVYTKIKNVEKTDIPGKVIVKDGKVVRV
jgi:predicted ribosome quality control (RQC) complex YloA/Tae2 family protein